MIMGIGSRGRSPSPTMSKMLNPSEYPQRQKPASGVYVSLHEPTIVFVTLCSEKRIPWVAQPAVHDLLLQTWRQAQAWLVGEYLLMPDHIHFFCAPRDLKIPLNRWMSYWKRLFSIAAPDQSWRWQSHHWDTRLRRSENYQESGSTFAKIRSAKLSSSTLTSGFIKVS